METNTLLLVIAIEGGLLVLLNVMRFLPFGEKPWTVPKDGYFDEQHLHKPSKITPATGLLRGIYCMMRTQMLAETQRARGSRPD